MDLVLTIHHPQTLKKCQQYASLLILLIKSMVYKMLPQIKERFLICKILEQVSTQRIKWIKEKVSLSDFIIAAPRKGISVGEFVNNYENKVIQRNLDQGMPLTKSGFLKPLAKLSDKKLLKAKKMKIAIPVRIHDLNEMREFIGTGCYEFHLSYDEVLSDDIERVIEDCNDDEVYSIHLPDYIT